MKALISHKEPVFDYLYNQVGVRVAQVCLDGETFPVAEDLEWVDCADNVVADQFLYSAEDQSIKPIPQPEPEVVVAAEDQPATQGAQTL